MFAFWMVRMMMACTMFRSAVGAMGALIGATFALFFIAAQFHKSAEKTQSDENRYDNGG